MVDLVQQQQGFEEFPINPLEILRLQVARLGVVDDPAQRHLDFLCGHGVFTAEQAAEFTREQKKFFRYESVYALFRDKVLQFAQLERLTLSACENLEWVEHIYLLFRNNVIGLDSLLSITAEQRDNFKPINIYNLLIAEKIDFRFVQSLNVEQVKNFSNNNAVNLLKDDALTKEQLRDLTPDVATALAIPNIQYLLRKKRITVETLAQMSTVAIERFKDLAYAMSFNSQASGRQPTLSNR